MTEQSAPFGRARILTWLTLCLNLTIGVIMVAATLIGPPWHLVTLTWTIAISLEGVTLIVIVLLGRLKRRLGQLPTRRVMDRPAWFPNWRDDEYHQVGRYRLWCVGMILGIILLVVSTALYVNAYSP